MEMGLLLTDFQVAVILVCGVISRDMGLLKIAVVCVQTIYHCFCGMCMWCMCVVYVCGEKGGGGRRVHIGHNSGYRQIVARTQPTHQVLLS